MAGFDDILLLYALLYHRLALTLPSDNQNDHHHSII
jgi:hypothetical protein